MEPIKITSLKMENVKRVQAVTLSPTPSGLTIIGGRNGQGKTSVLDAIAWALGGDKYRPTSPQREGSVLPPDLEVQLSNGLVVRRKGKASALTVTDPSGQRYGQRLLNEFVNEFAIDLPRFLHASDKDKAEILLQLVGVGDKLRQLEAQENTLYTQRRFVGQEADRKRKYADELPFYEGVPNEAVSVSELVQRQQAILKKNAENQRLRDERDKLEAQRNHQQSVVDDLAQRLREAQAYMAQLEANLARASEAAGGLTDASTMELEMDISNVEELNRKVRTNQDKRMAEAEAKEQQARYDDMTDKLNQVRRAKDELLSGAALPLPGLGVEDGALTYHGKHWDCMSGAEQLMVSAAIASALKPECGFILLDSLEQMDTETLAAFGEYLAARNLQAIATRVSTGEECTIIIEDGQAATASAPTWTAGTF